MISAITTREQNTELAFYRATCDLVNSLLDLEELVVNADNLSRDYFISVEPSCEILQEGTKVINQEDISDVLSRIGYTLEDENYPEGRLPDYAVLCDQLFWVDGNLDEMSSAMSEVTLTDKELSSLSGVKFSSRTILGCTGALLEMLEKHCQGSKVKAIMKRRLAGLKTRYNSLQQTAAEKMPQFQPK